MKTILHLIPTLEGGGAERQLVMLAVEQARRGWQVHVALRRGGVHEEALRIGGVTVHHLGDLRGVHPRLIGHVFSCVRQIRPDIVQSWLPQMDLLGGLVAYWNGIPWVLSERASERMYLDAPLVNWVRQRLGRHAAAIVANSADGAEYWRNERMPRDGVTIVSNALDVAGIRNAAPFRRDGARDDEQSLLFVGRLVQSKAPDIFLQALARLVGTSYHGVIIGDGPFRGEVQATIRALGLDERVTLLPYRSDWWGLLKTAAVFVSPSRSEGQPNVVLEAMIAPCPLVVSDIPAHRDILDDQSALIVPVDDPAALATAVERVFVDPVAARARAERAKARAIGLTVESAAEAYERIYEGVFNERVG